ncbi:unnamed protein product [Bursaphelenchus okinawaensis]|uniref:Brix domain-containing protein n=1 Tax=Bursaphelenchus okinawaensis TaxID=465554 RepID=A0A811JU06_9BILA|nr:unnamed protein product [Bursaphelenchus okinawaensis]CAG9083759.1 unnamed protein product [Bursaphelenchus okinawaensis]
MARKRGRGKSAKAARRGLLGLPKLPKTKDVKYAKVEEKREQKKADKKDAATLRAKVSGNVAEAEEKKIPRSFVIHTGKVGMFAKRLEHDLRQVMLPYTAKDLQVKKRNNFKDFLTHAGPLHVSHLVVLTRSDLSVNLRIIRVPRGPTIHFKVDNYTLAHGILSASKRPVHFQKLFDYSPLVILNGFNDPAKKHLQLVQTVIQNMFPSINVDTVQLKNIRRALLVNYNAETDTIDFRHYSIKAVPAGVSKSTKKLVQSKIPDLSKYKDISEFLMNPGQLSESEFEGEQQELELPQDLKTRGCGQGDKTKLRLIEIGPRMTWELVKVEEGIDEGEVLYHKFVKKSTAEVRKLKKKLPLIKKKKLREEKNIQHAVVRKLEAKEKREQKINEKFEEEKQRLIRKQRAVTGDYSSEDESPQQQDQQGQNEKEGKEKENDKKNGKKSSQPPKKRFKKSK